jgi:hypothetical protein
MSEWGIFGDESADYSEEESIEAGFYSREEAETAMRDRYSDDDDLHVHAVEEADEDEEEEDEEGLDELGSESWPAKG